MKRLVGSSLLITGLLTLAGCATKIVDTAPTSTLVAPTTIVPSGTAEELFPLLQRTIAEMSKAISDSNSGVAKTKLAEIREIWNVLQPQITERGDQFVQDLQRIIDLAASSVERNRPADADKALRFLTLVIETLQ